MDSDFGIARELSDLQKLRSQYQPELPPCLQSSAKGFPCGLLVLIDLSDLGSHGCWLSTSSVSMKWSWIPSADRISRLDFFSIVLFCKVALQRQYQLHSGGLILNALASSVCWASLQCSVLPLSIFLCCRTSGTWTVIFCINSTNTSFSNLGIHTNTKTTISIAALEVFVSALSESAPVLWVRIAFHETLSRISYDEQRSAHGPSIPLVVQRLFTCLPSDTHKAAALSAALLVTFPYALSAALSDTISAALSIRRLYYQLAFHMPYQNPYERTFQLPYLQEPNRSFYLSAKVIQLVFKLSQAPTLSSEFATLSSKPTTLSSSLQHKICLQHYISWSI
ncbi:unnamed protein product [Ilex paraguariensis]|uniref:Uncharacterized protein n=1 Tax=Ilex paraguariensis TaxID=185542 RepID=A0ABC8UCW8_9AQUA